MYTNQMLYWIISKCYKEKLLLFHGSRCLALCDILLGYLNEEALMKARLFSLISAEKPMTYFMFDILYGRI